jgi:hypothetical protein
MVNEPPPWVDDLFAFPTPPTLAALIDIAWQDAFTEDGAYDDGAAITRFDFMFDLSSVPRAPEGWECVYPGAAWRSDYVPLRATPELVQFGSLGTGAHVGWVVLAPELGRTDHPVALFGDDAGAWVIGADTLGGLEWLLSRSLRSYLSENDRTLIQRVSHRLGIKPGPELGVVNGRALEVPLEPDVPEGWWYQPARDGVGVGVLAPSDAFAEHVRISSELDEVLAESDRLLDKGYPASVLFEITDAFHNDPDLFPKLRGTWDRAYRDLGRDWFAERLATMADMY